MASDHLGTRYELLRSLGAGGMGEVFLARDLAAGQICALKRLGPNARSSRAHLRREFETLTRLRHPAIVTVYEFGVGPDRNPFYTMEYVPGLSPDRVLRRGDWRGLLKVGSEIAHGLEVLHAQGLVHGDVKPSNVLVVPEEDRADAPAAVRLVDFGLASALGDLAAANRGTSGFAAPEVVRGDAPTAASDLYGLGATLFTLACGQPPFAGETAAAMLEKQLQGSADRTPLERAGAPPSLIELVIQLLASEPRHRAPSAGDVRRELEAIDPVVRRPLAERLDSSSVVGRDRELAQVERLLGRKLKRSRMLVVVGAPRGGKTAFLGEVAARAALAGNPVVRFSGTGLRPADAILRAANGSLSPDAPLEELLRLHVESVAGPGLRPRSAVYVIDDAQALDPLSRSILRRLLLQSGSPILMVAARDAGAPAAEDERTLEAAGLADVLRLDPLDREATGGLIAARLREIAPQRLVDGLYASAAGNPGRTVDLLLRAARCGAIRESDAGLVMDGEILDCVLVPGAAEPAEGIRLEGLSEPARLGLKALAVLRSGTAKDLQLMDPDVDAGVLASLIERGLMRTESGGRFRLASALEAGWIGDDEARRLHRKALTLPDLTPAERFRHLRATGDHDAALQVASVPVEAAESGLFAAAAELAETHDPVSAPGWHERAARGLFRHGRYEAAVGHLERALDLDRAGEGRLERLYLLSSAHLRLGDAARTASAVAEALDAAPAPALRSRLLTNESARWHSIGDLGRAEAAAREALEAARAAGDGEAESMAAQSLVYILLARGRNAEAETMATVAVHACRNGGSPFAKVRADGARAAVAHALLRPEQALERYRAALEEARAHGLRVIIEELLINESVVLAELGRWGEVREANADAVRLALEDHRPRNVAVAMGNLAFADAMTGRPRTARREARRAVRLSRVHLPTVEAGAWRALARAERTLGDLKAAERYGRRAMELAAECGSTEEIAWCGLEYGCACVARGRVDAALTVWRAALDETGPGSLACLLTAHAGSAALALGRFDEAAEDLNAVERLMSGYPLSLLARGHALRLRAEMAIADGRLPDGVRFAAESLSAFERIPAPAEHAGAALSMARLVLEGEDPGRAPLDQWLEPAAAALERMGDYRGRERVLQALVKWFGTRGSQRAERVDRKALLESVSELLTSLSDLGELAHRAMGLVVEQLGAERGVFLILDPESKLLVPLAERGALDAKTRRRAIGYSRKVVQRVKDSGGSLLVTDAPLDPRVRTHSVATLKLRSIVCVPLHLGGRVVGSVYLDDSRRAHAFGQQDLELLEGIANLLAIALDRSFGQKEMERTNENLAGENRTLRREMTTRFRPQHLIGTSQAMQHLLPLIERAAATTSTVLITGESGTGKELVARVIHCSGKRALRPFVTVNCAALAPTLLESELFGILPNVATGVRGRDGVFRQADGGTLFLDEIGDMPAKQQVALLAAVANREITPVGGGRSIPVDVRIIAATHQDLGKRIEEGAFREDLYFRLNVFPIEVPPLRDRKADIPALARYFAQHFAGLQEREVPELTSEFMAVLVRSQWPGNVRELMNYIERIMAMNPGHVLSPRPLPRDLEGAPPERNGARGRLVDRVEALERELVQETLQRCAGNQSLAARELGITEPGMRYRMRKYGIAGRRQKRRLESKRRTRD